MKIHGIVYIIIGAFLAGFSYYVTTVNNKLDTQKFMLFIWTGGIFIAIGVFKLAAAALSKPRKPKIAKENFPQHQEMHHQQHSHQHTAAHAQHNQGQKQLIKFCSQCGSAVRHFDNFCYKCGSRMFHRR